MTDLLPADDAARLADCEEVISRGLGTFVEVGRALLTIRDQQLYRAEFGTFEAYCQERWSIERYDAYRSINAARVANLLHEQAPTNQAQATELAPLLGEPDRLREVWTEAVERSEGKPTAAIVREVREERAVEDAVAEFPDLAYYRDNGDEATVTRLAIALRGYDEPERTMRIDNLRKTIAAERRREHQPEAPAGPDYEALADLIFDACNAAAQAIAKHGGPHTMAKAAGLTDSLTSNNWRGQFASLADSCLALADACAPKLRSIR